MERLKTAAIYCRVSTERQEQEGTSLDTQKAANLIKAQELGYQIPESNILIEAYSGADTDRPQLNKLRAMIRERSINAVICYSTDRLSRKPIHIGIIAEECDKNHVELIFVTEPLDNSPEGSLIRYVKGFAAEIEREKIRERTLRGKKAKIQAGRIASGSHASLYGYDYIPVKEENGGRRVINELEAKWVRLMYQWLITDGMSTNGICFRLREFNVPTPGRAKLWDRSTVHQILKNEAYTGKTYAFTVTYGEPKNPRNEARKRKLTGEIRKDKSEWIEIKDVTPAIISPEIFEAAQLQLSKNRKIHTTKHSYLLNGFLTCKRCNRSLWGNTKYYKRDGKVISEYRVYRCSGTMKVVTPDKCNNPLYQADKLESQVWSEIQPILHDPKPIIAEIMKLNEAPAMIENLENQSTKLMRDIMGLDHVQEKMLDIAIENGFNDDSIKKKNIQINSRRQELKDRRREIQEEIDGLKNSLNNLENLEKFVELARSKMSKNMTFDDKRLALRMLGIKVYADGENIEVFLKPIRQRLLTQSISNKQSWPNDLALVLPKIAYITNGKGV